MTEVDSNTHSPGKSDQPCLDALSRGRTLIVGLGKTGLSCARFLSRLGVEVAVTDSRSTPPGLTALHDDLPHVGLFLGQFDPRVFEAAKQIIVSPGVPLTHPLIRAAQQRGVPVFGDIELFARCVHVPVVAITGSNGKSTVTTLFGEMVRMAGHKAAVGGNLGTPVLELLDYERPDLYVLELSSFQLETTFSLEPQASVILNISADHQDRYADMNSYLRAKERIYAGNGIMVINHDDSHLRALCRSGRQCVFFSTRSPPNGHFGVIEDSVGRSLAKGSKPWMAVSELLIPGEHNVANALAALALGDSIGLPQEAMLNALRRFTGLPHRVQFIAEKAGVRYYDDSKGTNVAATTAAITSMAGKFVLIAGGIGKGADFSALRPLLRGKSRAVVLIGRDAGLMESALQSVVMTVRANTMEQAVVEAQKLAQPGDSILLSPACASFDMFGSFEERGQVFAQAVRARLAS